MKDTQAYFRVFSNTLVKYKYVFIVAAVGVLLLAWPFGAGEETAGGGGAAEVLQQAADTGEMESRLSALLSKVDGVGRVEVMLSLKTDMEYVYTDEYSYSSDESVSSDGSASYSSDERSEYVTVRLENGDEALVLRKRIFPVYKGAVVVCDGADNASVRLKVINAVGAVTGLGSDRITVMKMK